MSSCRSPTSRASRFKHGRARVHRSVHGVAEAHDLLVPLQPIGDVGVGVLGRADLFGRLHGLLVRAAVQRSLQRADRAGDGAEHVGERRGDDPRRERRRVHRVVGVERERGVERVGVLGIGLVAQAASTGSSPRAEASGSAGRTPGRCAAGGSRRSAWGSSRSAASPCGTRPRASRPSRRGRRPRRPRSRCAASTSAMPAARASTSAR